MFESKYSKLLTVLLIGGIIIIVGALMFFGVQLVRNYYINKDAADAVERFEGDSKNENKNTNTEENVVTNTVAPVLGLENIISGDGSSSDENKKMYKGFPMVGTIEIPAINLKYPVLEEASKSAIEVAVAVYYGPGLNEVGNTTIVGHNYRNGTFFSNNKKLVEGDKVYIKKILEAMPQSKKELFFPIVVLPDKKIISYRCYLEGSNLVVADDPVMCVADFEK